MLPLFAPAEMLCRQQAESYLLRWISAYLQNLVGFRRSIREQPCGTFGLSVAKSTASHHFRVLREAGVIQMRAEGTQYINSLRRKDLDSRFPGLLDAVLLASDPI